MMTSIIMSNNNFAVYFEEYDKKFRCLLKIPNHVSAMKELAREFWDNVGSSTIFECSECPRVGNITHQQLMFYYVRGFPDTARYLCSSVKCMRSAIDGKNIGVFVVKNR